MTGDGDSPTPDASTASAAFRKCDKCEQLQLEFADFTESSAELEAAQASELEALEAELLRVEAAEAQAAKRVMQLTLAAATLGARQDTSNREAEDARGRLAQLAADLEASGRRARELERRNDELEGTVRILSSSEEELGAAIEDEIERGVLAAQDHEDATRAAEDQEARLRQQVRDLQAEVVALRGGVGGGGGDGVQLHNFNQSTSAMIHQHRPPPLRPPVRSTPHGAPLFDTATPSWAAARASVV